MSRRGDRELISRILFNIRQEGYFFEIKNEQEILIVQLFLRTSSKGNFNDFANSFIIFFLKSRLKIIIRILKISY